MQVNRKRDFRLEPRNFRQTGPGYDVQEIDFNPRLHSHHMAHAKQNTIGMIYNRNGSIGYTGILRSNKVISKRIEYRFECNPDGYRNEDERVCRFLPRVQMIEMKPGDRYLDGTAVKPSAMYYILARFIRELRKRV